jgi:hypothetical protein
MWPFKSKRGEIKDLIEAELAPIVAEHIAKTLFPLYVAKCPLDDKPVVISHGGYKALYERIYGDPDRGEISWGWKYMEDAEAKVYLGMKLIKEAKRSPLLMSVVESFRYKISRHIKGNLLRTDLCEGKVKKGGVNKPPTPEQTAAHIASGSPKGQGGNPVKSVDRNNMRLRK